MKNKFLIILIIFFNNVAFSYNPLKIQKVNSDYGVTAWLHEKHDTPIVYTYISFKNSGYAHDKNGKSGLSNIVAKMLQEGGGEYDSDAMADVLESNGIMISFYSNLENFSIEIKSLSEHFEKAMMIVQSVLQEPHFNDETLARIKRQQLQTIQNMEDNSDFLANKKLFQTIFKDSPYSQTLYGSKDSIKAITRKDLLEYVEKSLSRVNLNISVSGDITESKLSNTMDKYLSTLSLTSQEPDGNVNLQNIPNFPTIKKVDSYINKPQSVIYWGSTGIDVHDPDFYPAYVLSHVVGYGLDSILMSEIRKKRGLTYSISMRLQDYGNINLLLGRAFTNATSEQEVILVINDVLKGVKRDGISVEDLQKNKEYIINSFVMGLNTNGKIASQMSYAQCHNLSTSYINDFRKNIQNVTLKEVNNVAKKLLTTDTILFSVAGPNSKSLE